MSRYGNTPIDLPKGVEVKKAGRKINVKGPKGELELVLKEGVTIKEEGSKLFVSLDSKSHLHKAEHGLYRSLVNNMVVGVSTGFEKKLNLVGVGYRAAVSGNHIDLQLGFSHSTRIEIPKSVNVSVEKSTIITIQGIDKQVVGQFAASVRGIRPPEPYKGKGVHYTGEYVRKKAGKAAKGKGA